MMKNMTEGKPYKLILTFMIPVLFGHIHFSCIANKNKTIE